MRLRRLLRRALLAAAAFALLAARPALAQFTTDNDFPLPIGGGGPFAGSFLGPGLRTENELFRRMGERVTFRTPRIGCAVRGAAEAYADSVRRVARTPAEARVDSLLFAAEGSDRTALAARVAAALARGADPASPAGEHARELADALAGLFQNRGGCTFDDPDGDDEEDEYPEAAQWYQAIKAYNDFITDAPDQVFAPPAPELLAIHDALQRVIYAALGAARR
jgi:hypothetical protein